MYKQLGQGTEKERAMRVIEEEKDGEKRKNREKRVGTVGKNGGEITWVKGY